MLRLDHVQVTVPRPALESCRRFYGELLGLPAIAAPAEVSARGTLWFRLGELELHVAVEDDAAGGHSRRHIGLVAADLAALEQRLRDGGFAILADERPIPGRRRFFTRDPGGNRIEIAAPTR